MKKKNIILLVIALIVFIAVGFFIFKIIGDNGKKYEITKVNEYNYFVLKHEGKYGVIDKKGNIIISPEYESVKIPNPEKDLFICFNTSDSKVLNEKNELILNNFSKVEPVRLKNIASDLMYEKSVLKYSKDDKYGLVNYDGKQITGPIYEELDSLPYKEGELLVKQDGKYGIINIKGNTIIKNEYDNIIVDGYYTDDNGYKNAGYIVSVKTQDGYRYGYVNKNGEKVLNTEYNELLRVPNIDNYENAYLICAKNGQFGIYINENNILKNEYQSITFNENNKVFIVEKSKKFGAVDIHGKEIIPIKYNQIDVTGIYLYAKNEQGTVVYDRYGKEANINSNISILDTDNENYKIKINNENGTKYGVINKEGKILINEKYNYISYLFDNYFIVSVDNGKLGVVDDKDNIKIDIKYDSLQKINENKLIQTSITQNKNTQIYSKDFKLICEMKNAIIDKQNDFIKVYNESETKFISKDGKEIKNTEICNKKLYAQNKDGKWGFVDFNGNVKIDYRYDKATEFNNYGFAAIRIDNLWGAIDEQGNVAIEPIYEIKSQIEPSFISKYYKIVYGYGEFYYTDDK